MAASPMEQNGVWRRRALLSMGALGVVFGDIGTSPLYAMRECFFGPYGMEASRGNVLGVLSLITWSLILVISIKYLFFVLRADNEGEGGILALMELVRKRSSGRLRRWALGIGLFGAALLYGDGMITPAISVLSAMEGLEVATPAFIPYVVPLTIGILVVLFVLQRMGTGGVGRIFGPIMLLWFTVLAVSGLMAVVKQPFILTAVDPRHGLAFLARHGIAGLTILGVVFLVVTGGEALYADMGHFGKGPIRMAWFSVAFPGLLLNYFGQGSVILSNPGRISNPFYQMVAGWALYPMVVLAAAATTIASQAIISGVFSLTWQGMKLGYLPFLKVRHTSAARRGRIYVPSANWVLLVATVGLVLGFRRSGNLAAAYGVAIATTMVVTSVLFFFAMRKSLGWSLWVAIPLTAAFLIGDTAFFLANIRKFADGGWLPMVVAGAVFLVMTTWRKGTLIRRRKSHSRLQSIPDFLSEIGGGGTYRRVPGQVVYLTGNARGIPYSMRHNLRNNHALHHRVVIFTASMVKAPYVSDEDRFSVDRLRDDIARVVAHYGFMETPDVPEDLGRADRAFDLGLDLDRVTYILGGDVLLPDGDTAMTTWRARVFAFMARNEARSARYFGLPRDRVVEIGAHIDV